MSNTAPRWFTVAAIAAVLFELFGCVAYGMDALRSPQAIARLPIDQQMMWAATPTWIYAAYGLAVFTGLAGAIGLLLRRGWSVALLGLSVVAVIVQFGGIAVVPALRRIVAPDAMIAPFGIIAICLAMFALARLGQRRGWLG